jgi:hypothetical protein
VHSTQSARRLTLIKLLILDKGFKVISVRLDKNNTIALVSLHATEGQAKSSANISTRQYDSWFSVPRHSINPEQLRCFSTK